MRKKSLLQFSLPAAERDAACLHRHGEATSRQIFETPAKLQAVLDDLRRRKERDKNR